MADDEGFYKCECFFTHNIFLGSYEAHVVFENESKFESEYRRALFDRGCRTKEQWERVLKEIINEVKRRRNLENDSFRRKELISLKYKPLHLHVYKLQESFLADAFLSLVKYASSGENPTANGLLTMVKHCDAGEVYTFKVFTPRFCQAFLEELHNFEESDLPKERPNTMNQYGILLDELGFDEHFLIPLRNKYLIPICKLLYPDYGGDFLDSHKAFTVQYRIGKDLDLSYHYDNAEVTLNVCLGGVFTGGELYFGDLRQVSLQDTECTECSHVPGYGILHRGQHMHGALPIRSGERHNLIIWMRSSKVRNKLCPMCHREPRLVPSVGSGDGFTSGNPVSVCATL